MNSCPSLEVEFEIGVVWDKKLLWYIKKKDKEQFGNVFIGPQRDMQLSLEASIKHEVMSDEDWEGAV